MLFESSSLFAGLLFALSLIVAIGAQNVFVLRQGLLRTHVTPVVALCSLSDIVLIAAGIAGVGALVEASPAALTAVTFGGVVFLVAYGIVALRRMTQSQAMRTAEHQQHRSLKATLLAALAITWLNPYVYLDTVVLLGSVANSHPSQLGFGVGACLGSFLWFAGLGYGARRLQRLFEKPLSWRVLDGLIAVTMLATAGRLVMGLI